MTQRLCRHYRAQRRIADIEHPKTAHEQRAEALQKARQRKQEKKIATENTALDDFRGQMGFDQHLVQPVGPL